MSEAVSGACPYVRCTPICEMYTYKVNTYKVLFTGIYPYEGLYEDLARYIVKGWGFMDNNNNKGRRSPEEKVWERVLDCLSLGLCQLFECSTPH